MISEAILWYNMVPVKTFQLYKDAKAVFLS